jgi:hypothetical protein
MHTFSNLIRRNENRQPEVAMADLPENVVLGEPRSVILNPEARVQVRAKEETPQAPTLDALAHQHRVDGLGDAPPETEGAFREWLGKLKPITELQEESKTWRPYEDSIFINPHFELDDRGQLLVHDGRTMRDKTLIVDPSSKAERQLASRLGLPSALPEKLRGIGATEELARIFDKAARQGPEETLFRATEGGVFAALSPSYLRMDNRIILGPMLSTLDPDAWGARNLHFADPSFSSWSLVHRESARMVGGDRLMVALTGSNSEDGGGSLRWSVEILRLACLNGLLLPMQSIVSTKMVHRGRRIAEEALAMAHLPAKVLDMVPDEDGMFSTAENAFGRIERAQEITMGFNEEELIQGIGAWAGMTMGERNNFRAFKLEKYRQDSVWHWSNAITELGKSEKNPRRNMEIQTKAWEFMCKATEENAFAFAWKLASDGRDRLNRLALAER